LDWRTTGDASESALIKFFQPLRDIEDYRNANPQVPRLLDQALESEITKEQPKKKKKIEKWQVFGVPFNSTNKYQLSIHKQEDAKDPRLVLLMKVRSISSLSSPFSLIHLSLLVSATDRARVHLRGCSSVAVL
jgi:sodium/potassium-transporting ATPase subunit alpha